MGPQIIFEGTAQQQAWLQAAWSRIKFPWEKISKYQKLTIGVKDLDAGLGRKLKKLQKEQALSENHHHDEHHHDDEILKDRPGLPGHAHIKDPRTGEIGHAFTAIAPTGRRKVAGVFWTDGRIYINDDFVGTQVGFNVMASEAGHFVDYGLPLTEAQKTTIMGWWHPQGSDKHTWWEINSYSDEYFTLGGEAFMDLFDSAYTDNAVGVWPNHSSNEALGDKLRLLLKVDRTDAAPPPPPLPPEQVFDSLKVEKAWVTAFGNAKVDLRWDKSQIDSANVAVWRQDGTAAPKRVYTTPNDGAFTQNLKTRRGMFIYWLRDQKNRQSNSVTVNLGSSTGSAFSKFWRRLRD